jgi:hypothetical protein
MVQALPPHAGYQAEIFNFLNIAPLDDRSLEPFLLSSLNELVYGDLVAYRTDRATCDD